jgi:hypothetical protein
MVIPKPYAGLAGPYRGRIVRPNTRERISPVTRQRGIRWRLSKRV